MEQGGRITGTNQPSSSQADISKNLDIFICVEISVERACKVCSLLKCVEERAKLDSSYVRCMKDLLTFLFLSANGVPNANIFLRGLLYNSWCGYQRGRSNLISVTHLPYV